MYPVLFTYLNSQKSPGKAGITISTLYKKGKMTKFRDMTVILQIVNKEGHIQTQSLCPCNKDHNEDQAQIHTYLTIFL